MAAEAQRQGSGLFNGFVQDALVAPGNFLTSFVPDAIASGGESLRPFGQLADRVSDATPLGRGLEIGFRAAMGGYSSVGEFSADVRTRLNPFGIAEAQWDLGRDLFVGFTAEAREDFANGHYGRGTGRILGNIFDAGTVLGALSRSGRVASALGNAADGLSDAARVGGGITREGLEHVDDAARVGRAPVYPVSSGGLRNDVPLTDIQRAEAISYARSLGMPEQAIRFSDNMSTAYSPLFGQEILYVGSDLLPAIDPAARALRANSRVTMRGALAHEIVGHRAASRAGRTQLTALFEEAQASIRAARFAPGLSGVERITLLRDAIERLRAAGVTVREVKPILWITEG